MKNIVTSLLLFTLTACAASPALNQYPRSEIDRPYTIPKGIATWHIPTIVSYNKDYDSGKTFGAVFPFIWEVSLSDNWNMLFAPIPLGVTHQFINTEDDRLGFSLMTGISFNSNSLRLRPGFSLAYRHRVSDSFAIDIIPSFISELSARHEGETTPWVAGLVAAPLFQISETFSLAPELDIAWNHETIYQFQDGFEDPQPVNSTNTLLGGGLSFVWSFTRQWDLRGSYRHLGLNSSKLQSKTGIVEFVHFW